MSNHRTYYSGQGITFNCLDVTEAHRDALNELDDALWHGKPENLCTVLKERVKHYKELLDKGILYEPLF